MRLTQKVTESLNLPGHFHGHLCVHSRVHFRKEFRESSWVKFCGSHALCSFRPENLGNASFVHKTLVHNFCAH